MVRCDTRFQVQRQPARDAAAAVARRMLSGMVGLAVMMMAAALYALVRPFAAEQMRWVALAAFVAVTAQATLLAGAVVWFEDARIDEGPFPPEMGALQLLMAAMWFGALTAAVAAFEQHNFDRMLAGWAAPHDLKVRVVAGVLGAGAVGVAGLAARLLHTDAIAADTCDDLEPEVGEVGAATE